jgi:hypothetical protein
MLTHYCAGDKIEKGEMSGACRVYGEGRRLYRVMVGKPEGKRPLGRPKRRWEDNMYLQEVGLGEWTGTFEYNFFFLLVLHRIVYIIHKKVNFDVI